MVKNLPGLEKKSRDLGVTCQPSGDGECGGERQGSSGAASREEDGGWVGQG